MGDSASEEPGLTLGGAVFPLISYPSPSGACPVPVILVPPRLTAYHQNQGQKGGTPVR